MSMDTERSLKEYLRLLAAGAADGADRPAGPDVRLRGERRARASRRSSPSASSATRCASATTTSWWSTRRPPVTSSASSPRRRPSTSWCRSAWSAARPAGCSTILSDPALTGLVIVATPEEMPVNETIELAARVRAETTVDLAAVVVNRVLPELFGRGEEEVFDRLREPEPRAVVDAAVGGRRSQPLARRGPAGGHPAAHPGRPPRAAARRARPRPAAAVRALPVRPHPRAALDPGGRRGARRRAGVLMAAPVDAQARARSSSCSPPTRSSSPAARAAWARRPRRGRRGHGRRPPRRQGAGAHRRPGQRLANALGLEGFGNVGHACPDEAFTRGGRRAPRRAVGGDARHQAVVGRPGAPPRPRRRHRGRILDNPLYQNITGRFVQSHDYIAMERLYEIHLDGATT